MSADDESFIQSMSDVGIAAEHPSLGALPVFAAPSTDARFNTLSPPLKPIACWSIGDARFEFSSSFLFPEVAEDIKSLAALVRGLEGKYGKRPVCSIFGHSDPVGKRSFNKKLSGRRAAAVYGMLTRRIDIWEDIFAQGGEFTSPLPADEWGTAAIQTMLTELGYTSTAAGDASAAASPPLADSVKAFQRANGLAEDGDAGPDTRARLFGAYMDKFCRTRKEEPFKLEGGDFLGGGQDSSGKGDYQGCSEFNPLLIFSKAEHEEFSKTGKAPERDDANAPNRRVVIFLFKPGFRIAAAKWPCPRAKEGLEACEKRLWSDAENRVNPAEARREFQKNGQTFACRFYHRLAEDSPCEVASIRGFAVYLLNPSGERLPAARWRLRSGEQVLAQGTADHAGLARAFLSDFPDVLTLEWREADDGSPESGPFRYVQDHFPLAGVHSEEENLQQMLNNLGYGCYGTQSKNVCAFQRDFGLPLTGQLTDIAAMLHDWHRTGTTPPRKENDDGDNTPLEENCTLCGADE